MFAAVAVDVRIPPKYALPVVVAPPEIVSPVICVPPPMVEDAEILIPTVVVGDIAVCNALNAQLLPVPPPPEPHALPVLERSPAAENVAQPADPMLVTIRLVVEAVPEIVRPPAAVPSPIVELASAYIPLLKPISVEVAFALVEPKVVGVNGNICESELDEILLLNVVQSPEDR